MLGSITGKKAVGLRFAICGTIPQLYRHMAKTKQIWKSVHLVHLWSSVKRTFQTGQKGQKEAER